MVRLEDFVHSVAVYQLTNLWCGYKYVVLPNLDIQKCIILIKLLILKRIGQILNLYIETT